jgi:hypothetical protein
MDLKLESDYPVVPEKPLPVDLEEWSVLSLVEVEPKSLFWRLVSLTTSTKLEDHAGLKLNAWTWTPLTIPTVVVTIPISVTDLVCPDKPFPVKKLVWLLPVDPVSSEARKSKNKTTKIFEFNIILDFHNSHIKNFITFLLWVILSQNVSEWSCLEPYEVVYMLVLKRLYGLKQCHHSLRTSGCSDR